MGILIHAYQNGNNLYVRKPSFEEWYKTVPIYKNDTNTYDLRSAYKELPYRIMKKFATSEAHLPDTYKKPNHPTFSEESIYNSEKTPGGKWIKKNNKWYFYATDFNVMNMGGPERYKAWFSKYEPESILVLPKMK